jgi:hypothetical protein
MRPVGVAREADAAGVDPALDTEVVEGAVELVAVVPEPAAPAPPLSPSVAEPQAARSEPDVAATTPPAINRSI